MIDDWPYLYTNAGRNYDVSNDGMRFLVIDARGENSEGPSSRPEVRVVQSWFEELEEQVPVN